MKPEFIMKIHFISGSIAGWQRAEIKLQLLLRSIWRSGYINCETCMLPLAPPSAATGSGDLWAGIEHWLIAVILEAANYILLHEKQGRYRRTSVY